MSTEEKKPADAPAAPPTKALAARWENAPKGLPQMRACLDALRPQLAVALPKCGLTTERLIRTVTTLLQTTDRRDGKSLVDCTTLSVVGGVMAAAQLGLEIGTSLGQAYLVPHRVQGALTAVFIPGYRGMIDLSRRSGTVSVIDAVVVHRRDPVFRVVLGIAPRIDHEPYTGDLEAGDLRAVYARCLMRDGSTQFVFLTKREVDSVRKRSKAGDSGPWVSDFEEMAKKTAIRRLWKVLPVSVEKAMQKAIAAHDRAELGDPIDASGIVLESGDVFGVDPEGPGSGEVVATEPAKRTRRTGKVIDQAPAPAADANPEAEIKAGLVKIHERIRAEDPEAFAVGWNLPVDADIARFDLTKQSVDALTKARDDANEWAERNPPASDTQKPAAQAPKK
jgi:recombination protein RecT